MMKMKMVNDGFYYDNTFLQILFSLNYELFDVTVQKPLVEIASNGVVDETLPNLGLVARLVAEHDVVVPAPFRPKVAARARAGAASREVQ